MRRSICSAGRCATLLVAVALGAGCSRTVYCWRNRPSDYPHCYESTSACEAALLARSFEEATEQIQAGAPEPRCTEEAR